MNATAHEILTEAEIATRFGVSVSTIRNWERDIPAFSRIPGLPSKRFNLTRILAELESGGKGGIDDIMEQADRNLIQFSNASSL